MLKNMQHLEEVCNVTLVRQDNDRIRAHKLVLGLCEYPFNGESTVKGKDCEDFLKIKIF